MGRAEYFDPTTQSRKPIKAGSIVSDAGLEYTPDGIKAIDDKIGILTALPTAIGVANTYSVTIGGLSALTLGLKVTIKFNLANTGTSTLNINGLGARAITKAGGAALTSGNLKANGVYSLVYDGTSFQLQGEGGEYGTALASDVLSGKTIGTENGLVSGTIPKAPTYPNENSAGQVHFYGTNSSTSHSSNNVYTQVPSGYYSDNTWLGISLLTLIPANIKTGVVIGGGLGKPLTGTYTGEGDALAANVLAGSRFSTATLSNAAGTMVNRGTYNATVTTQGGKITIPAGYHNGVGGITASFANLVAGNVKKGVNVGGVVGTLESRDYFYKALGSMGKSITKTEVLPFVPSAVIVSGERVSGGSGIGATIIMHLPGTTTFTGTTTHLGGSLANLSVSGTTVTMTTSQYVELVNVKISAYK